MTCLGLARRESLTLSPFQAEGQTQGADKAMAGGRDPAPSPARGLMPHCLGLCPSLNIGGGKSRCHWDFPPRRQRSARDVKALAAVGLRKRGRHWVRDALPVAVAFPGSGDDIERTVVVRVAGVSILMISCEDLYLDRVACFYRGYSAH
jgi:hypothetical protein